MENSEPEPQELTDFKNKFKPEFLNGQYEVTFWHLGRLIQQHNKKKDESNGENTSELNTLIEELKAKLTEKYNETQKQETAGGKKAKKSKGKKSKGKKSKGKSKGKKSKKRGGAK
jgi:hypothetical protein